MMGATCIATRGYICPPPKDFIQAVTCDAPTTATVVEVRPTVRGNYAPEAEEPIPQVAAAQPVAPSLESVTDGQVTTSPAPALASVTLLRPAIVSAEEE